MGLRAEGLREDMYGEVKMSSVGDIALRSRKKKIWVVDTPYILRNPLVLRFLIHLAVRVTYF